MVTVYISIFMNRTYSAKYNSRGLGFSAGNDIFVSYSLRDRINNVFSDIIMRSDGDDRNAINAKRPPV
jgi:hypothetical protein